MPKPEAEAGLAWLEAKHFRQSDQAAHLTWYHDIPFKDNQQAQKLAELAYLHKQVQQENTCCYLAHTVACELLATRC